MSILLPINAENWYAEALRQGLSVGNTLKLGAVMCWQKGATLNGSDGAGHLAVVEEIVNGETVVTSESGYGASAFWVQRRTRGSGNWGQGGSYRFLGFLYHPLSEVLLPMSTKPLRKGDCGDGVRWMQWHCMSAAICGKMSRTAISDALPSVRFSRFNLSRGWR